MVFGLWFPPPRGHFDDPVTVQGTGRTLSVSDSARSLFVWLRGSAPFSWRCGRHCEGARVIASAALLTRCRSLELHGKTLPEYCSKISKVVPANYKVYGYLNDTIATFAAVRV